MFPAEFGTEDDGRADPVIPGNLGFMVRRLESGSLPLQVVEILIAVDQRVFLAKLLGEIKDARPFRSKAGQVRSVLAVSAVGVGDE